MSVNLEVIPHFPSPSRLTPTIQSLTKSSYPYAINISFPLLPSFYHFLGVQVLINPIGVKYRFCTRTENRNEMRKENEIKGLGASLRHEPTWSLGSGPLLKKRVSHCWSMVPVFFLLGFHAG